MKEHIIKYKVRIIVGFIIFIAAILRFFQLGSVPVSLYWDEAAIGYNAYSIIETGKDEFGTVMPVLFRSFEDYKTSGYIYLTAVAVKLFGLNEFSVRFFSAFLGTFTILLVFFLTKKIVANKKLKNTIAYIAAVTLTISPWHIQFSRAGFEANAGVFFVVLGILLFVYTLGRYSFKVFLFSLLSFTVSCYFYRSFWIFVPIFISSIFLVYRKFLFGKKVWKRTIIAGVLCIVLLIPLGKEIVSHERSSRTGQVTIFTNSDQQIADAVKKQQNSGNSLLSRIIYNRRVVYGEVFAQNYLLYFSPKFLIWEGDGNGRHSVQGMGLIYYWQVPFLLLGVWVLYKRKISYKGLLILWFFVAPIAGALSTPSPHSLRALQWVPILAIVTALGFYPVFQLPKRIYRYVLIGVISCWGFFLFGRYFYSYYAVTANAYCAEWGDGYKQLMMYATSHKNSYDKIIISGHYWQPYIYALFYSQYAPEKYQQNGTKTKFDIYNFGGTSWDRNGEELGRIDFRSYVLQKRVLVALSPQEYPRFRQRKRILKRVKTIKNHRGDIVFYVGYNR